MLLSAGRGPLDPHVCSWFLCLLSSVLTNRLCTPLSVCPGLCLCHQSQLPSCFKLKHLKHFSCVILVQFMQLKTGSTHPQSWCYSNSVTLLELTCLKENWSYARTDSEHPFQLMQLFYFSLLFYFFEWSLYAYMPTSLHKVDTAPNRHWHMNKGPAQCILILCKHLNSGKGLPRCSVAYRSSGWMLPLLLTSKFSLLVLYSICSKTWWSGRN